MNDAQKPQEIPSIVYDKDGNPIDISQLKRAQQNATSEESPQVVFMTRPHEPIAQVVSETGRKRHTESLQAFPYLNLSEGEYVISFVRRHPIGLLEIWGVVALVLVALAIGILPSMDTISNITAASTTPSPWLPLALVALVALVFLGGIAATMVYEGNKFFLTNESVTQHIQTSLFVKKEQTISLSNIEDASFRQHGMLQYLLNYGSLRLSTQGDETTYRFNYVANPGKQLALLNNAVEAFKNGRPIDPDES